MRLDHVGVNVADLSAMTEWYAAALGLDKLTAPPAGRF